MKLSNFQFDLPKSLLAQRPSEDRDESRDRATDEDQDILGHLMLLAGQIANQLGLDETFRLVVNNGAKAGQSVFHLHLHLLSGRPLNWPPG